MICVLTDSGYCERHRRVHEGRHRELALDASEAGERYRLALDENTPKSRGGPGTELMRLFSELKVVAPPSCDCKQYAAQMDAWGVEGCRQRRAEIVAHLEASKAKWPWGKKLWTIMKVGAKALVNGLPTSMLGLVDEAIRRTHSQEGWAYGVTTVPSRKDSLLPKTLASLASAGFDRPRLFVDGASDGYSGDVTYRNPAVRITGNWMLSALELYTRNPAAKYYAIFQDDVLACRNLRKYLEASRYPTDGYWNLITYPINERKEFGWSLSNQKGKGAQGLVFSNEAIRLLLASQHMVEKLSDPKIGWCHVDGGIVTAFRKLGWKEYCHSPSLIGHTGLVSSFGNMPQPTIGTFLEDYDPLNDPRRFGPGI